MGCNDCQCLLAVVISIIVGIALGTLYAFGFLPLVGVATIGILIFAVIGLVLLTLISVFGGSKVARCICGNGNCLLAGIIGTLIFGIISLAVIELVVTIQGIIVVALLGFFTALYIISLTTLIRCLIDVNCRCRE